jgi:hypothetical protein
MIRKRWLVPSTVLVWLLFTSPHAQSPPPNPIEVVYSTNANNGEILKLDFATGTSTVVNTDTKVLKRLEGLAVRNDGSAVHLIVSDSKRGEVLFYENAGGAGQRITTAIRAPDGVSLDLAGNAFVVGNGDDDDKGGFEPQVWTLARGGTRPGGYQPPVLIDPGVPAKRLEDTKVVPFTAGRLRQGDLLVLSGQPATIFRYPSVACAPAAVDCTGFGTREVFVAESAFPAGTKPTGFAFAPNLDLLVAGAAKSILRYNPEGGRVRPDFAAGAGYRGKIAVGVQDGRSYAFVVNQSEDGGGSIRRFLINDDGTGAATVAVADKVKTPRGVALGSAQAPPTPTGQHITVTPAPGLTLTFDHVGAPGLSTARLIEFEDNRFALHGTFEVDQNLRDFFPVGSPLRSELPEVMIPAHVQAFRKGDPITGVPTFLLTILDSTAVFSRTVSIRYEPEGQLGYQPLCTDQDSTQQPRTFHVSGTGAAIVFSDVSTGCGSTISDAAEFPAVGLAARDTREPASIVDNKFEKLSEALASYSCIEPDTRALLEQELQAALTAFHAYQDIGDTAQKVIAAARLDAFIAVVDANPDGFASCNGNVSGKLISLAESVLFALGNAVVDRLMETTLTVVEPNPTNDPTGDFAFASTHSGGTFECAVDGVAFTACASPFSTVALADGSHVFEVRGVGPHGNPDATPASYTWVVDTIPPDTTITSTPSNPTNLTTSTFTFTAAETGGTFECVVDDGAYSACTSPHTTAALADGSHTFAVRALDALGNVDATPANATWVVDTIPPDTTFTATEPDPTNDPTGDFAFTATEIGVTFKCRVDDGAFTACLSPHSTDLLTGGAHTFAVRAVDGAGNVDATPVTFGWVVDLTPPIVTIDQAVGQADPTNAGTINFTVVFSEPVTDFTAADVSLAGSTAGVGTLVVTGGPLSYNLMVNATGNGTISATVAASAAQDAAGNFSAASTSSDNTVTLDTTAPATTLTSTTSNPTNDPTGDFAFTATEIGVTFECRVDDGAFTVCLSPHSTKLLVDGSHTFTVRAVDAAGNVDPIPAGFTWIVDTTPPDTTLSSTPSNPTNSSTGTFTFTGTESGETFQCRLGAGAFALCASGHVIAGLADGSHTFTVRAVDAAGNVDSTPASYTWVVDTTAPLVTINQAAGQVDPTGAGTITFTAVFSEPVTGFTSADVSLAGSTASVGTMTVTGGPSTYNVAVNVIGNGSVSATVVASGAQDAAGNSNTASTSTDNTVTRNTLTPANLTLSPSPHNFGSVTTGQSSATVAFTVTNTGQSSSGSLSAASLNGADPAHFTITSTTCGAPLAASGTCTVNVRFAPVTSGAKSASLSVNATPGGTSSSTLTGTGLNPVSNHWWNAQYLKRHSLTVSNTSGASAAAGYSVSLTFNHAALVAAADSRADGNDIRVIYWNGAAFVELDRVLAPTSNWNQAATTIVFPLAAALGAGATSPAYAVYFDNAAAGPAPASYSAALRFDAGWTRQTEQPTQTLGAPRLASPFFSVQLRQLDTIGNNFEVHVFDQTFDPSAFGRLIITDNVSSSVLHDITYGDYGNFDVGGTFSQTIAINSNNFRVSVESREFSATSHFLGTETFNYQGYAFGTPSSTTTRNYTRLAPATPRVIASVLGTENVDDPNPVTTIEFLGAGNNTSQWGNTGGGSAFNDSCPANQALIGFSGTLRPPYHGAIAAQCGTVSPANSGVLPVSAGTSFSGHGCGAGCFGEAWVRSCPANHVIVGFRGRGGLLIDQLTLRCAPIVASEGGWVLAVGGTTDLAPVGGNGGSSFPQTDCPAGQVATVSRVRAGDGVDAFGLACKAPSAQ